MTEKHVNIELLKSMNLFENASLKTLEALCKTMKIVYYPKGSHVLRDKQQSETIYIVLSGKFVIYKINDTGNKRVIFIQGTGILLNDNLKPNLLSAIYAESFEDSAALICSKNQFLDLISQDFNLTQAVIEQYSSKLRRTCRQLKNAPANISIEKKLAAKIYALSRDYGIETSNGILIDLPLTVTNIAEMLGTQRETISRSLKKLVQEKLIVYEKKKILIKNLEEIARFHKNIKNS